MNFETDFYARIFFVPLLHQYHHNSGLLSILVLLSNNKAALNNFCSWNSLAIICKPMGRSLLKPAGTVIAGTPARLAITVSISIINIFMGSSIFSPNLKGKIGIVGAIKISYFLNNDLNSCFNMVLIF